MSAIGSMMLGSNRTVAAAGGGDSDYSLVELLISGGEANNSTTIKDYSKNAFSDFTAAGSSKYSTAQAKYASTSIIMPGGVYRTAHYGTGLQFPAYAASGETGDWTWEAWLYPTALAGCIAGQQTFGPMLLLLNANGSIYYEMGAATSGTFGAFTSSVSSLTTNSWQHLAVTRKNDVFRLFVGGTQKGTSTSTGNQRTTAYSGQNRYEIGFFNVIGSNEFQGHMEDIRFTKGKARYTSTFTPPSASFAKS